MTTYENIKLIEIFSLYGNPFTRGSCKKNIKEKICQKYFKRVDFKKSVKKENNGLHLFCNKKLMKDTLFPINNSKNNKTIFNKFLLIKDSIDRGKPFSLLNSNNNQIQKHNLSCKYSSKYGKTNTRQNSEKFGLMITFSKNINKRGTVASKVSLTEINEKEVSGVIFNRCIEDYSMLDDNQHDSGSKVLGRSSDKSKKRDY